MKIIVNNATMTFVKGEANIFENSTWVNGYWNRTAGQALSFNAAGNYVTIETPIDIPSGVSTVKITWDESINASNPAKMRIVFFNSQDKVAVSAVEHEGGSAQETIPEGAVKMVVQALSSSGPTYLSRAETTKGVFE